MELQYYVVDGEGQLRRVARETVEGFWKDESTADTFGFSLDDEFRLISVVVDENLQPVLCYFLRLDLELGLIATNSRREAFEALTARSRRKYDHPAAKRQFSGWPANWQTQLAVALDVPVSQLQKIGIGGPLVMSQLWGVSVDQIIEFIEDADDK